MTVVSTVIGIALSIRSVWGREKHRRRRRSITTAAASCGFAKLPEDHSRYLLRQLFGFGPFAGCVTLAFATSLLRQAARRRHEDMDPGQPEDGARHRRRLAAMDQTTASSRR